MRRLKAALALFVLLISVNTYALDVVRPDPGYYAKPNIGRPVSNGSFYVGIKDLDPEILANQKQVTIRQESGVEIQIPQPVDLSAGGVPEYLGSPVTVLVDGVYSLKVLDYFGVQVYYIPESEVSISELIDYDHETDGSHIVFGSIAELRASALTPFDGQVVKVTGYYAGTENRKWFFRWRGSSTTDDDGGVNIKNALITTGRWERLIDDEKIYVTWFGAKGLNTDDTAAINAAAAYCEALVNPTLYFPSNGKEELTIYKKTAVTQILNHIDIRGENKYVTVLCEASSGFEYTLGIQRTTVEKLSITTERHTTTPNSYFAIKFIGSAVISPGLNTIDNVYIDGFGEAIVLEWWVSGIINNVITGFCGKSIVATGVSINNKVTNCLFSGIGTQLDIGDGTNTVQGWSIANNTIDSQGIGVPYAGSGTSYMIFDNNICDNVGPGTAILFQTAGGLGVFGNIISNNYIGFAVNGTTGIRMLNSGIGPTLNTGNVITGNQILAYPTYTLDTGILLDGASEENNRVYKNIISAVVADINNSVASNSVYSGNIMLGAGFDTAEYVEWGSGNIGLIQSADQSLLKQTRGDLTTYYSATIPTTGTYTEGDNVVYLGNYLIDSQNMVFKGWVRLTNGSAHVLNVDWAEQYTSAVSPAN